MESPFAFTPAESVVTVGKFFGTPLKLQGLNWLPLNQVLFWGVFTWQSWKARAGWPVWKHLLLGGAKMTVVLGSEWCHNLAHTAAARAVGKPVDALRILFGMPVLIYNEPEHSSITPRMHIIRSLAGPACNACLLAVSHLFHRITRVGSPGRDVADAAVVMNTFITTAAFVPLAEFDGGPVMKWSLISGGYTPNQAAVIIRNTNRVLGSGLTGAAVVALTRRNWLLALLFALLGGLALRAGFMKTDGE